MASHPLGGPLKTAAITVSWRPTPHMGGTGDGNGVFPQPGAAGTKKDNSYCRAPGALSY
jgi:hypothetical protein